MGPCQLKGPTIKSSFSLSPPNSYSANCGEGGKIWGQGRSRDLRLESSPRHSRLAANRRLNPTYTTSVGKMSAITESSDAHEVIHVLFTLHPGMDALDFVGPLEVLSYAQHNPNDSGTGP